VSAEEQKRKIMDAAMELLRKCNNVGEVTNRAIATKADVNQAMVNYYFVSKDALLQMSVRRILGEVVTSAMEGYTETGDCRKDLLDILSRVADHIIVFEKFKQIYLPGIMMEGKLYFPKHVYRIIRSYYGVNRTDAQCKVMSYQLINFLHSIFYHPEAFKEFSGIDIYDPEQRSRLISDEVDLFLAQTQDVSTASNGAQATETAKRDVDP
jgi:TetR/AcrR family transcriptional regulator, regulator of cefoperazone and chloramphenicol sensitivity